MDVKWSIRLFQGYLFWYVILVVILFLSKSRIYCYLLVLFFFNSSISIIFITIHAVRISTRSCQSFRKGPKYTLNYSAKESVTAILAAAGKPVDAAQVAAVIDSLKGRTVTDVP